MRQQLWRCVKTFDPPAICIVKAKILQALIQIERPTNWNRENFQDTIKYLIILNSQIKCQMESFKIYNPWKIKKSWYSIIWIFHPARKFILKCSYFLITSQSFFSLLKSQNNIRHLKIFYKVNTKANC
jgi:hypothetical protein